MLEYVTKLGFVWAIAISLVLPVTAAIADEVEGEEVAVPEAPAASEAPEVESPARRAPGLEEITVTARKKANVEALQEVPIAVSAFTGNYLEQNFVENLTDLSRSAPNVQMSNVGTFA